MLILQQICSRHRSGSGACAVLLVCEHDAARVIGVDVENPVCEAANRRAKLAGVEDRVEILKINPGPFPFDASTFDIVFSKDSIIHIPDKAENGETGLSGVEAWWTVCSL